jgi:hypothetical protein
VRTDVDPALIMSILECTFERMQDSLLTGEGDRELFHRTGLVGGNREELVDQFLKILRGAIGTSSAE